MDSRKTFVIVGAGLAGAKAARRCAPKASPGVWSCSATSRTARTSAHRFRRTTSAGETRADELFVHDHDFYDDHGIELVPAARR